MSSLSPSATDRHPRRRVRVLDTEICYVDTGQGEPIVFLHGNPTYSYLWRNIIPFVGVLGRCLAPDLVGMGQSGPSPTKAYRFFDQARYLDAWFETLGLERNVIFVLHDWGSALGFHRARRHPDSIQGIVYMEAIVQPRRWSDFPSRRGEMFRALRSQSGEIRSAARHLRRPPAKSPSAHGHARVGRRVRRPHFARYSVWIGAESSIAPAVPRDRGCLPATASG